MYRMNEYMQWMHETIGFAGAYARNHGFID
jgi:hypothetical protein